METGYINTVQILIQIYRRKGSSPMLACGTGRGYGGRLGLCNTLTPKRVCSGVPCITMGTLCSTLNLDNYSYLKLNYGKLVLILVLKSLFFLYNIGFNRVIIVISCTNMEVKTTITFILCAVRFVHVTANTAITMP